MGCTFSSLLNMHNYSLDFTVIIVTLVRNLPADSGGTKDVGSIPGLGRFPWRKKWQPAPVFFA